MGRFSALRSLLMDGPVVKARKADGKPLRYVAAEPSGTGAPMAEPEDAAKWVDQVDKAEDSQRRVLEENEVFEAEEFDDLPDEEIRMLQDDGDAPPIIPGARQYVRNPAGSWAAVSSPYEIDIASYGKDSATDIALEMARRSGVVRDASMPSSFPDRFNPLRHYFGNLLLADEIGGGSYNPGKRVIKIDSRDSNLPSILRHEGGHAGTLGMPLTSSSRAMQDPNANHLWLSYGTANKPREVGFPHQVTDYLEERGYDPQIAANAEYLLQNPEFLTYARDFKNQLYYGLLDGKAKMERPYSPDLAKQLEQEMRDFHGQMKHYDSPSGRATELHDYSIDNLGEGLGAAYQIVKPDQRNRMALAFALLSGAPLMMAGEQDGEY